MAELIEVPFGLWTQVGRPRNHVLDGGSRSPMGGAILRRKGVAHCKVYGHSAVSCAKTAESRCHLGYGLCWAQ